MTAQIKEPITDSTSTHGSSTWESGESKTDKLSGGRFFQGSHNIASTQPRVVAPSKKN